MSDIPKAIPKHLQDTVWVRYSSDVIFPLKVSLQMVSKVFTVLNFITAARRYLCSVHKIPLGIQCNNYCQDKAC